MKTQDAVTERNTGHPLYTTSGVATCCTCPITLECGVTMRSVASVCHCLRRGVRMKTQEVTCRLRLTLVMVYYCAVIVFGFVIRYGQWRRQKFWRGERHCRLLPVPHPSAFEAFLSPFHTQQRRARNPDKWSALNVQRFCDSREKLIYD